MRVKKTTYILLLFIITWATVVYLAFKNNPTSLNELNNGHGMDVRMVFLEEGISEQYKSNQDMIYKLHRYLDRKKQLKEPLNSQPEGEPIFKKDFQGTVIPVLVFACNRVSVSRCLDQLIQYRPNPDQFPIIVSQVRISSLWQKKGINN